MAREKYYEYKKINSKGAYIYLIKMIGKENWKMHRWDGPAIEPHSPDSEFFPEYYLNGIKYNQYAYSEIMQEREGLPWYKNQSMKHLLSDYRN
tara:strand:+ start:163 stop:441 length:279 start_codon:yes stop_codon:yes gene_type:complete